MTNMVNESRLKEIRSELSHGEGKSQAEIDDIVDEVTPARKLLRPGDKEEALPLFDQQGRFLGTTAPRWFCHFFGLRHRCAHILLIWKSPTIGEMLVLQIRDWKKDDSPGHLDISVGGHMTSGGSVLAQQTAFNEMLEELNLSSDDLEEDFIFVGGYPFDESRDDEGFYNSEWRDVYIGLIKITSISRISFPDGEVAGVVLIPIKGARLLLQQNKVPIASALRESLPKCLEFLESAG